MEVRKSQPLRSERVIFQHQLVIRDASLYAEIIALINDIGFYHLLFQSYKPSCILTARSTLRISVPDNLPIRFIRRNLLTVAS